MKIVRNDQKRGHFAHRRVLQSVLKIIKSRKNQRNVSLLKMNIKSIRGIGLITYAMNVFHGVKCCPRYSQICSNWLITASL